MRAMGLLLAGAAFGIALVVACGGVSKSQASPQDCAAWQVAYISNQTFASGVATPLTLPAGWEPFMAYGASTSGSDIYARRCKPTP